MTKLEQLEDYREKLKKAEVDMNICVVTGRYDKMSEFLKDHVKYTTLIYGLETELSETGAISAEKPSEGGGF